MKRKVSTLNHRTFLIYSEHKKKSSNKIETLGSKSINFTYSKCKKTTSMTLYMNLCPETMIITETKPKKVILFVKKNH